jgi:serine/threonine protein kinase
MTEHRLPPVGFWSYSRQDEELSRGKLCSLRSMLHFELQQQIGRDEIQIFQDTKAIPHGAAWEQEIKTALGAATFFIPIITPNFLQSDWCCQEVNLFHQREAELLQRFPDLPRMSRIFPVYFIDVEDVDPVDTAAIEVLRGLQWFDFRRLRHRSYDEAAVREPLSDFASSIRDLVRARVSSPNGDAAVAKPSAGSGSRRKSSSHGGPRPVRHAPCTAPDSAGDATLRVETFRADILEDSRRPAIAGSKQAGVTQEPAGPTLDLRAKQIGVGDILNHMFEVKRFIKAGGMGQVFEACNVMTGERLAIKALLPGLAADPKVVGMLKREAMTLTKLRHEALVQYRVLAKEPQLGILYIVTEFIDGVDLGEALDRVDRSPIVLGQLLRRLASGLAVAHRLGAIHRDISPDNVMLPGMALDQAKIIDFGIAKDLGGHLPTLIGDTFAGKLGFVAPEQLGEHGGEIGSWTDVYSLALVILSVAKGEKVDMAGSFADAIRKRREGPDLSCAPEELRPLLSAMLRVNPAERVRTMDEVIARLGGDAATQVRSDPQLVPVDVALIEAPRAVEARPPDSRAGRRRKFWLSGALGVAVIGAVAVLLTILFRASPVVTPPPDADAWVYGRWGLDRDCSLPINISGDARRLLVRFNDSNQSDAILRTAPGVIVTARATYARSGQTVNVSEVAASGRIDYVLGRCA